MKKMRKKGVMVKMVAFKVDTTTKERMNLIRKEFGVNVSHEFRELIKVLYEKHTAQAE